jgi:hypothetical protein
MDRHLDFIAMTRQMFVHGIVQDLAHAMMQGTFVGAPDVHARLLPHCFQPLELAQF